MINRSLHALCFCAALYLGLAFQIEGKVPMMVSINESSTALAQATPALVTSAKSADLAKEKSSVQKQAKLDKKPKSAKLAKNAKYDKLAKHISRKYRVDSAKVAAAVDSAIRYGRQMNVDPFVILAVAARESSFRPEVLSKGDHGLMQVNPKYHGEKLQGQPHSALFDIEFNVKTGTKVLAEYKRASNGSYWGALRRYNGLGKPNQYPDEVLAIRNEFTRIANT